MKNNQSSWPSCSAHIAQLVCPDCTLSLNTRQRFRDLEQGVATLIDWRLLFWSADISLETDMLDIRGIAGSKH